MRDSAQRVLDGMREFFDSTPTGTDDDGSAAAARLLHEVADTVPAYRAFLAENGYTGILRRSRSGAAVLFPGPEALGSEVSAVLFPGPEALGREVDWNSVPLVTKENYLLRHPLPQLWRDGTDMLAVSSGSSGRPTVWPRSVLDELVVARRFELAMVGSFRVDERRTLVVVCFALGSWVGGMYTAAACRHLAAKGYPVTVVTPGNNIAEILRVVREVGPHYEQVVLAGYPPFVKNVIDDGLAQGVDWPALSIRLLLAGEVFSEQWRDLVGRRAGMTRPVTDSVSMYGTADAGVLGTETPLSVTVRRFLAAHPDVARELFGESRLPTLVQYDPRSRFFETHGGTLVFTADGSVPLVRYHIADEGGLVTYTEMLEFCHRHDFDPLAGLEAGREAVALPFVYVFGRSLFTVSYFGANVYPENVTVALERADISTWVTGKFVLDVVSDEDEQRRLRVVVELAPGETAAPGRPDLLADAILAELRHLNSEFANYVPTDSQRPLVELRPTGDPADFPAGVKHRYTRS